MNADLAKALDAKVLIVSTADIRNPAAAAEKIETQLRHFGGAGNARTAGALFMRTKGLPEGAAQVPVTLDPNLRLIGRTIYERTV